MTSEVKLGFSFNPSSTVVNSTEFVTLSDADNGKYFLQKTEMGLPKLNENGTMVKDYKFTMTIRSFESTPELRVKDILNSLRLLQVYITRNSYAHKRYGNVNPNTLNNEGYKGQFLYLTFNAHSNNTRVYFDVLDGFIVQPSDMLDKLTGTPLANIQLTLTVKANARGDFISLLSELDCGDFAMPFDVNNTYTNRGYTVAGTNASTNITTKKYPTDNDIYGFRYGKQCVELKSSGNTNTFVTPDITPALLYKYLTRISVRFVHGINPCFEAYLQGYNTALARFENIVTFFNTSYNLPVDSNWNDIISDIMQNYTEYSKYRILVNSLAVTDVLLYDKKIRINGLGFYQLPTGTINDDLTEFLAVSRHANDAYVTMYNMRGDSLSGMQIELNSPNANGTNSILLNTCFINGQFTNYEIESPLMKLSMLAERISGVGLSAQTTQFWGVKAAKYIPSIAVQNIQFYFGPTNSSPYNAYKYDSVPRGYRVFIPIAARNITLGHSNIINTLQLKLFGQNKFFDFSSKPLSLPYWSTTDPTISQFRLLDCGEFRVKKNNYQNIDYEQLITDITNNILTVNCTTSSNQNIVCIGGIILVPLEQSAAFSFGLGFNSVGDAIQVISQAENLIVQYTEFGVSKDIIDFGIDSEITGDNIAFVPSPHGENSGTRFDILLLTSRDATQKFLFGYDASGKIDIKVSYRPMYLLGV